MEDAGKQTSERAEGEAAYRGFLFADLRGYTAYVERHGASAAADLLDAYRQLVRAEVARHAGAEIRTEGDSFYVVFGSARRAVVCGMSIVDAAITANREHPERPIRVGIGINAGETIQRGEGFIGTAVNLAARVCAQAREGEVLVTAGVRDVLGSTPDLHLVPRGTRRLKGIARPVALFAVQSADQAGARSTVLAGRRRLLIAAALLSVPLLVGVIWVASRAVLMESDGTAGPDLGEAATSSLAAVASASPIVDPNAFPNAAELGLVEALDPETARDCERADEDDRPALFIDRATAQAFGITTEERTAAHVGIACEVPSVSAPDIFHLWVTRQTLDFRAVDVPKTLILNKAGRLGIAAGDCDEGGPAYEEWQVGSTGGFLLCYESFGDAIIEWSYQDRPIFGQATRRDGDLTSLLAWWEAEARLLNP